MNSLNPFQAFANAIPAFSQPILPGWTLNIDSNNSSSPRTEGLVVSRFSYGRQLGQINDALAAIIATLPAATQALPQVKRFIDLKAREPLPRPITLTELRGVKGLEKMVLLQKGSRLSVQPVTAKEWEIICKLAGVKAG